MKTIYPVIEWLVPLQGKMLLDCNGGRIQEGQSKIRSGCSCRKEWWRQRRIVQFFFLWLQVRGHLYLPGECQLSFWEILGNASQHMVQPCPQSHLHGSRMGRSASSLLFTPCPSTAPLGKAGFSSLPWNSALCGVEEFLPVAKWIY